MEDSIRRQKPDADAAYSSPEASSCITTRFVFFGAGEHVCSPSTSASGSSVLILIIAASVSSDLRHLRRLHHECIYIGSSSSRFPIIFFFLFHSSSRFPIL
ncbi:uncharacterized protein G2W53_000137 [Senna tora]|uniref:Uncharacterized protein n=1 Tax=Senna tora TaxID=362788 RepID=A0A834XFA6_9FABA|nr:uncharacterized protein G2W53_000137 [Senna tora]